MTKGKSLRRVSAKPTLLLTNDDGIRAPGIRLLCEAFAADFRVTIAAPDRERSGVGHAFTFNKPLHYEPARVPGAAEAFAVSGTPVDCVKFAVSFLMKKKPDVIVSGLNLGENSGLSAFYSGTVAAAREGAFWNIPSVAFSVCIEAAGYAADYATLAPSFLKRILAVMRRTKNNGIFYNVNFPPCDPATANGVLVTEQSMAFFDDRYKTIDVENHRSKKGYVICGEKKDIEPSNRFDSRAIMNGYIAITPLGFNATARTVLKLAKELEV
jgi:5'-nucleotidase